MEVDARKIFLQKDKNALEADKGLPFFQSGKFSTKRNPRFIYLLSRKICLVGAEDQFKAKIISEDMDTKPLESWGELLGSEVRQEVYSCPEAQRFTVLSNRHRHQIHFRGHSLL